MIYVFHNNIENIIFRIKAIQKCYKQINNVDLKYRLFREYKDLEIKFFQIKSKIKLMANSSSNKISVSKLLNEKCIRCEKEIFKNKYLFSA